MAIMKIDLAASEKLRLLEDSIANLADDDFFATDEFIRQVNVHSENFYFFKEFSF